MRSPLEHEPELIAGVGLITVRWAALEKELAKLLGFLMLQSTAGERMYYGLGNFSQRLEIVKGAVASTLASHKHREIAITLFEKVGRIWKSRNRLVHSHYVYLATYADGTYFAQVGEGNRLGPHPDSFAESPIQIVARGKKIDSGPVVARGFAYETRGKHGERKYVPVNKGTFETHAVKVHRRGRQIALLRKSISKGRAPIICSDSAVRATSPYKRP